MRQFSKTKDNTTRKRFFTSTGCLFFFKPQDESVHITYEPNDIDMQPIIVEKHRPEIKFKKKYRMKQNVSRSQEKL